jgi:hypothetical protein
MQVPVNSDWPVKGVVGKITGVGLCLIIEPEVMVRVLDIGLPITVGGILIVDVEVTETTLGEALVVVDNVVCGIEMTGGGVGGVGGTMVVGVVGGITVVGVVGGMTIVGVDNTLTIASQLASNLVYQISESTLK